MRRLAVLVLLAALVLATPVLAQNQPPPPPGGGPGVTGPMGGMPMPGRPGGPGMMPGMGMMMPPTPVMLVVPDRFLYVIYNGVLFQFDANTLELLKQVPLMPPMMGPGGGLGAGFGGRGMAPAQPPPPQN